MVELNPAWIFWIASALRELTKLNAKDRLSAHVETLVEVKTAVTVFINYPQYSLFPETRNKLKDLAAFVEVMLPSDRPFLDRVLQYNEIMDVLEALRSVRETFDAECGRNYVVGLERQRALDTKTLIESIEVAFAPKCWQRLSPKTKREIEESGKCLIFERYTGAGFHMMRAVESEIRDYIFLLLRQHSAKRDWGYYLETLKNNGADQKLTSTLDNMRNLDRNPIMHPDDFLDIDDAVGIFNLGQTAVDRLIADMEKRQLLPPLGV
jgi:hypothetical protein